MFYNEPSGITSSTSNSNSSTRCVFVTSTSPPPGRLQVQRRPPPPVTTQQPSRTAMRLEVYNEEKCTEKQMKWIFTCSEDKQGRDKVREPEM